MAHSFAWSYRIALRETLSWYVSLKDLNKASDLEGCILLYAFSEYLHQMRHGIMISQSEIIRPSSLGIEEDKFSFCDSPDVIKLTDYGFSEELKKTMINSLENGIFPNLGLNDDTLDDDSRSVCEYILLMRNCPQCLMNATCKDAANFQDDVLKKYGRTCV